MPRILFVTQEKGGVGKTVFARALAEAVEGAPVFEIDASRRMHELGDCVSFFKMRAPREEIEGSHQFGLPVVLPAQSGWGGAGSLNLLQKQAWPLPGERSPVASSRASCVAVSKSGWSAVKDLLSMRA